MLVRAVALALALALGPDLPAQLSLGLDRIPFFTLLCALHIIYLSVWRAARCLQKDLRFWRSSVHSRRFSRAGYLAVRHRHWEGRGSDCAQITSEGREKCCFFPRGFEKKKERKENGSVAQCIRASTKIQTHNNTPKFRVRRVTNSWTRANIRNGQNKSGGCDLLFVLAGNVLICV